MATNEQAPQGASGDTAPVVSQSVEVSPEVPLVIAAPDPQQLTSGSNPITGDSPTADQSGKGSEVIVELLISAPASVEPEQMQANAVAATNAAMQVAAAAQQASAERPPSPALQDLSGRPDNPLLYGNSETKTAIANVSVNDCYDRIAELKKSDALYHWALAGEFVLLMDSLKIPFRDVELKTGFSKTKVDDHCLTFKSFNGVPDDEKRTFLWTHYDLLRKGIAELGSRLRMIPGAKVELKGKRVKCLETIKANRCRHAKHALAAILEVAEVTEDLRKKITAKEIAEEKKKALHLHAKTSGEITFLKTTDNVLQSKWKPDPKAMFLLFNLAEDGSPQMSVELCDLLRLVVQKDRKALVEWNAVRLPFETELGKLINERLEAINGPLKLANISPVRATYYSMPTGRFSKFGNNKEYVEVDPKVWHDWIYDGIGDPAAIVADIIPRATEAWDKSVEKVKAETAGPAGPVEPKPEQPDLVDFSDATAPPIPAPPLENEYDEEDPDDYEGDYKDEED